ncbi:hypothetical protein L7F22_013332 [Adiantum nelumboides]|nr:hypothetical protein [Adiantum nelumboides]
MSEYMHARKGKDDSGRWKAPKLNTSLQEKLCVIAKEFNIVHGLSMDVLNPKLVKWEKITDVEWFSVFKEAKDSSKYHFKCSSIRIDMYNQDAKQQLKNAGRELEAARGLKAIHDMVSSVVLAMRQKLYEAENEMWCLGLTDSVDARREIELKVKIETLKETLDGLGFPHTSRKAQYPKQTKFCFTQHDLHEEYGLSLEGKLYQHFSDEDVTDEDWLAVFTKEREKGVRIFLNMVQLEYEEECRLLFHKVYQAIPTNKEITHKFSTLFVYERCPAVLQSTTGQRKVAWAVFGEQVLDHCKKLPSGMEKKLKNWNDSNENGQHVIGTTQSTPKALLEGMMSNFCSLGPQSLLNCTSINLQIMAEVEQMLAARKSTLESVKSTLNAAQVQLQEKHQSMWKIEGTSSAAAVLQGQLTELQSLKDSMEGGACGASSSKVMVIDENIIFKCIGSSRGCASNSKIRDDVDRIDVCMHQA